MYPQIKKRRTIITICITIFIFIISYFIYDNLHFHIISTNPNPKSITIISPFLKINTNNKLSPNIKVIGSDNVIRNYSIKDKQIYIEFNTILSVKKYTISVSNIKDLSGNRISDLTYTFTPKIAKINSLPNDQLNFYLDKQTNYSKNIASGIYPLLPYTGANFSYRITYDTNSNGPIFTVKYLTDQAKLEANKLLNYYNINSSNSIINYQLVNNI